MGRRKDRLYAHYTSYGRERQRKWLNDSVKIWRMGVDEDRGETIHYIHMNEIMPLMPMLSMVHKAALRVRR